MCALPAFSAPIPYRENWLELIKDNYSTGGFVQLVLLRLRTNVVSLLTLSDNPMSIFLLS